MEYSNNTEKTNSLQLLYKTLNLLYFVVKVLIGLLAYVLVSPFFIEDVEPLTFCSSIAYTKFLNLRDDIISENLAKLKNTNYIPLYRTIIESTYKNYIIHTIYINNALYAKFYLQHIELIIDYKINPRFKI